MSVFLEFKKAKRTGLLPTYIAGGMLAGNMNKDIAIKP